MGSTNLKYTQALAIASADDKFKLKHPRYHQMNRDTLYSRLTENGYEWDVKHQWWDGQQPDNKTIVTADSIREEKASPDVFFLVRFMAPKSTIDKVHADFIELSEALGWEVVPSEKQ